MGIEIIATLSQKNNGKFPLVDSNDIGGGFYQVDSIEERDLIPDVRRKEGMLCYVKDDKLYQLIGGIGNEYWSIFSSSESDVIKEYVDKQLENKSEKGHTHEEYAEKDSVYTTSEIDEKIAMIPTEVYHVGEMPPTNTDILWIDNGDETLESIDGTILDEVRFSINNKILNLNKNSHNHTNADILNQISASRVSSWDNKSTFSGSYNDLTNKPTIPTKTSQLTNDSNYLTSVPSEYITESELSGKGYLTSIPNTYALKTDIPTIPTSLPANGGNANTVSGYSIWIGTQTQYDAISTKSSTTIYMIRG